MNVRINNNRLYKIPTGVNIKNGNYYCTCGLILNYRIIDNEDTNLFSIEDNETTLTLPFVFYPILGDYKRLQGLVKGQRHNEIWKFRQAIVQTYPNVTEEQTYACIKFVSDNLFTDPFDEKDLKIESKILPSDRRKYTLKKPVTSLLEKSDVSSKVLRKGEKIHKQLHNILEWNDYEGATNPAIKLAEFIKNKAGDNKIFSERAFSNKEFIGVVDVGIIYPNNEVFIYDVKTGLTLDYEYAKRQLNIYANLIKKYKVIGAAILYYYDITKQVSEIPVELNFDLTF